MPPKAKRFMKKKVIITLVALLCAAVFVLPVSAAPPVPPPSFAYILIHIDERPVLFLGISPPQSLHAFREGQSMLERAYTLDEGQVRPLLRAGQGRWGNGRIQTAGEPIWLSWDTPSFSRFTHDIAFDFNDFSYTISEYRPNFIRPGIAAGEPTEDVIYRLLTDPEFVPEPPEAPEEREFDDFTVGFPWYVIGPLIYFSLVFVLGAAVIGLTIALIISHRKRKRHAPKSQNDLPV